MTKEQTEYIKMLERNGRITAAEVLDAARPEDSPIHACFDWDNSAAAELWRLEQARDLIRRVRIEVTYQETTIRTVAYVRDPVAAKEDEGGYVHLLKATKRSAADIVHAEWSAVYDLARRALDITQAKAEQLGNVEFVAECEVVLGQIKELANK